MRGIKVLFLVFLITNSVVADEIPLGAADNQLPLPKEIAPKALQPQGSGFVPDFKKLVRDVHRSSLEARLRVKNDARHARVNAFRATMDPKVLDELTRGAQLTDVLNGRPIFTAPTNNAAAVKK